MDLIELRSLKPLDMDSIRASLARTHKLVILDESTKSGGVGAGHMLTSSAAPLLLHLVLYYMYIYACMYMYIHYPLLTSSAGRQELFDELDAG